MMRWNVGYGWRELQNLPDGKKYICTSQLIATALVVVAKERETGGKSKGPNQEAPEGSKSTFDLDAWHIYSWGV